MTRIARTWIVVCALALVACSAKQEPAEEDPALSDPRAVPAEELGKEREAPPSVDEPESEPSESQPDEPEPEPEPPSVDHSELDALLKAAVKEGTGRVDYALVQEREAQLDAYLKMVSEVALEGLGDAEVFALYANAYNAYTLKTILERYPKIRSIRDIKEPWKTSRWVVAGQTMSLDQMEHEVLRPRFKDPRVLFAVNCAAIGCPALRASAFTGAKLDAQLEAATKATCTNERYVRVTKKGWLELTKIFEWYGEDFVDPEFKGSEGTVAEYVAKYATDEVAEHIRAKSPKPRFMEYDWDLNDVK